MVASLLGLYHLWWFSFFYADLIVKDNRVYLIDAIRILILNIIIRRSYNSPVFVFFSGVISKYILVH